MRNKRRAIGSPKGSGGCERREMRREGGRLTGCCSGYRCHRRVGLATTWNGRTAGAATLRVVRMVRAVRAVQAMVRSSKMMDRKIYNGGSEVVVVVAEGG